MKKEYPEERELEKIKTWKIHNKEDAEDLIDYICDRWKYADWGIKRKKGTIELCTGGWSGNEDIIDALSDNLKFWSVHWKSTERGGKFVFETPKSGK